jgi:hypothetical protein
MSRRTKLPPGQRKSKQRPPTEAERTRRLIADTLATFTCATQIAHDFLHQCVDELESLDCQIDYNQLALQMWGSSAHAQDLVSVLSDYLAARMHHRDALTLLRQRLTSLTATPNHQHLEPADWHDAVSKRVLFVPPTT